MRCTNPFTTGTACYGCGQCMPCRFNRRRLWTHRIMLEALCHEHNAFITLTLTDENVDERGGSVAPLDVSRWLKRLRKSLSPDRFRFVAVGEYGNLTGRPHYHAVIFGLSCSGGPYELDGGALICRCRLCSAVRSTWPFGHVLVAMFSPKVAAYISRYVVKKWTRETPSGLKPEFARYSLRPGIGASAAGIIARALVSGHPLPTGLRHGRTIYPLGRYLRRKINDEIGGAYALEVPGADEELQVLRALAFAGSFSVSEAYAAKNEGYERVLKAREMRTHETF